MTCDLPQHVSRAFEDQEGQQCKSFRMVRTASDAPLWTLPNVHGCLKMVMDA